MRISFGRRLAIVVSELSPPLPYFVALLPAVVIAALWAVGALVGIALGGAWLASMWLARRAFALGRWLATPLLWLTRYRPKSQNPERPEFWDADALRRRFEEARWDTAFRTALDFRTGTRMHRDPERIFPSRASILQALLYDARRPSPGKKLRGELAQQAHDDACECLRRMHGEYRVLSDQKIATLLTDFRPLPVTEAVAAALREEQAYQRRRDEEREAARAHAGDERGFSREAAASSAPVRISRQRR